MKNKHRCASRRTALLDIHIMFFPYRQNPFVEWLGCRIKMI